MYESPLDTGTHSSLFTAGSYWITLIGVFLAFSALHRYKQFQQRTRQNHNKNSTNPVPIVYRTPAWRRWLNHSIRIPKLASNINIKSILYISVLVAVNVIFILFNPTKTIHPTLPLEYNLVFASIRCAHMALANIGIAMLLITRNSILKFVSGKSFDELLPLHRWHGLLGLAEICFHVGVQIKMSMDEMSASSPGLPKDQEHTSGFAAFIGLLIVFMSSMEVIRRNSFPVFYISHITGVFLFVGAGFAHQYSVIVLISPPLFFYVIDRVTRSIRSWTVKTHAVEITLPNQQDVTKVVFTKGDIPHKVHPGQFVFLSMNDGSFASKFGNFFDWHPFTISEVFSSKQSECVKQKQVGVAEGTSSMDLEKSVATGVGQPINTEPLRASVHMKQQGRFTSRIHSQVMKNEKTLHVNVDGPYGSSTLALERHNVVVFFEAGIGITPSLTMLRDLAEKCITNPLSVQTTDIYFVWATANMNSANVFLPQLMKSFKIAAGAVSPPHIECDIFLTQSSAETSDIPPLENLRIRFGRPVVQDVIYAIDSKHSQASIALQTCGPTSFTRQAANAANKKGWIIRKETFEF